MKIMGMETLDFCEPSEECFLSLGKKPKEKYDDGTCCSGSNQACEQDYDVKNGKYCDKGGHKERSDANKEKGK